MLLLISLRSVGGARRTWHETSRVRFWSILQTRLLVRLAAHHFAVDRISNDFCSGTDRGSFCLVVAINITSNRIGCFCVSFSEKGSTLVTSSFYLCAVLAPYSGQSCKQMTVVLREWVLIHSSGDNVNTPDIHSLVFSLRGRAGRNQNPVMWPVWLSHTASWASSWG